MTIRYTTKIESLKTDEKEINADDFIKFLNPKSKQTYCEVYDTSSTCKPFFDIDYTYTDLDNKKVKNKSVINNAIKYIVKEFDCRESDLAISTASREDKSSYHVIINGKKIKYTNLMDFKKDNKDKMKKYYFDTGIYGKWFKLRTVLTRKKDIEDSLLIPITHKDNLKDHLLNYVNESDILFEYTSKETKQKQKDIVNDKEYEEKVKEQKIYLEKKIKKQEKGDDKKDRISKLANLILIKYLDDYHDWRDICFSLKVIGEEHKDIAKKISKKSSKYDNESFNKLWDTFEKKKGGITERTFYYYCKLSNPVEFNNIIIDDDDSIPTTDIKMAKLFIKLYGNDFLSSNGELYYFNGIHWEADPTHHKLFKSFCDNMPNVINRKLKKIILADNFQGATVGSPSQKLMTALQLVEDYTTINKVIKSIIMYLEKDKMKWETNKNLFVFNNCVYDIENNKFVEPRQEDYMNMSTGYDYKKPTEEEIQVVRDMIIKVFPEEDVRKSYMTLLSTSLEGFHFEKFIVANGSGGNGKGFLHELTGEMLGDYFYNAPNNILINPLKSGNNPEVANMKDKRLIIYKEPDTSGSKKLNFDTIKELTGGDEINARLNYSNDTKTTLKGTHILECNERLNLNCRIDDSVIRRLLDVGFVSRFISKSRYDEEEKDGTLTKYTQVGNDDVKKPEFKDQYKIALFHVLLEYWTEFKGKHIDNVICQSIKDRTSAYLQDSDELSTWFSSNYIKTEDKDDILLIRDIYDDYQMSDLWSNMSKRERRALPRKKFIEKIKTNMYLKKYYKSQLKNNKRLMKSHNLTKVPHVLIGFKKEDEVCMFDDENDLDN